MSHIHIDIEHISFGYTREKDVLKDLQLHLGEQDSVGLIGANGAGKSTLLKLLVGLELPLKGTLRVEEIPVEKGTLSKIRERIGYVFQDSDSQLFMTTVEEDVAFAPRNYGLPKDEVERRVSEALSKTHAEHLRKERVYELSGGEKKLVSIATVLSMKPDILLMDEPSASLDPRNRRRLIGLLKEFDHLKVLASHDLDFIWDTCNRVILLSEGQIVADGSPEDIFRREDLLLAHGLELPLSLQKRDY